MSTARLRVLAAEKNKTAFASRTGNITMNTTYQPFNKNQRFDKDQGIFNVSIILHNYDIAVVASFKEDNAEALITRQQLYTVTGFIVYG